MNKNLMAIACPKTLLLCSLIATGQLCFAENIPNAGQLLQEAKSPQIQPAQENKALQAPAPQRAVHGEQQVFVRQFEIQGNTQFSELILRQQIQAYEGKQLTLTELQQAANKVSDYYAQNGYSYSYAFLPAQTLNGGSVILQVVEAQLNGVHLSNASNTQSWLVNQMIAPLQNKQLLSDQSLDEISSRLNRLNGVKNNLSFTAGQSQNETLLNVELASAQKYQAYLGADNFGGKYTGKVRGTGGVRVNSLLGLGDQLSLDAMSSGQRMNYGKIGYSALVHGSGTQLGVSYSYLEYELGQDLKDAGYEGNAKETSVWLQQPVMQSTKQQTMLSLNYTYKQLEDDVKTVQNYNHRNVESFQLGLNHSSYDSVGGAGFNEFVVINSFGHLDIKDDAVKAADALSRQSDGDYLSVLLKASRLQKIMKSNELFASVESFYSPDNLDSSEAYYVGGSNFMRGYKSSVFSASQGLASSLEFRQDLWSNAQNRLNGKLFLDMAKLKLNAQTWVGSTEKNTVSLRSAGIGLSWDNRYTGSIQATFGFPLGDKPVQMNERDDYQVWLNWQKTF